MGGGYSTKVNWETGAAPTESQSFSVCGKVCVPGQAISPGLGETAGNSL
ncbi:protein of unknown function [Azospirillum baldaniorum]|uniref:Uncharacterized protein n=1 Tax=Azospirillum baldaniorum TaxID=1064539 RepID=A0A9P1JN17_9PROT|nr:protein of unknown function [Azospirillum baldaniorum]